MEEAHDAKTSSVLLLLNQQMMMIEHLFLMQKELATHSHGEWVAMNDTIQSGTIWVLYG